MSRLFPELEGQVQPVPAPELSLILPTAEPVTPASVAQPALEVAPVPVDARPIEVQSVDARPAARGSARPSSLVGGEWALRKFDQVLGLPGPFNAEGGCHVVSARIFADGHLELEVLGGGAPRTVICFWNKGEQKPFVESTHIDLGYKGKDLPEVVGLLLKRAALRFEKATMQTLRKVILMDPEKRLEGTTVEDAPGPDQQHDAATATGPDVLYTGESGGGGGDVEFNGTPPDNLTSLVQSYGSENAWFSFFADKEQQRNFCHNVSGNMTMIGHEDMECHYATPSTQDGTISFFNYPLMHERYRPSVVEEGSNGAAAQPRATYLVSDLHDLDIIKGGTKKLDRVLDSILQEKVKPDMVLVRATCVPIVIGDDMEGSVEKFRKKSGLPVVYLDNLADPTSTPFKSTFGGVKDEILAHPPQKIPGTFNLVGYPKESQMGPMLEFLARLGITVNARVLPEVDVRTLRRYAAAEFAVLFDADLYDRSYDEVLNGIEMKSIRPMAPYGVGHMKAWLQTIADELGRVEGFDALWEELFGEEVRRLEEMKREVAGYRLGFVVDEARAKLLTEPRRLVGIPVVDFLLETGFGVDLLLHVPPNRKGPAPRLPDSLVRPGVRVVPFGAPEELATAIRESEAHAFYSEVFFDRRLTRLGKGQFSSQHFEMGTHGAIASLDRLLSICRMPFYRRYGGYLGRAFQA